MVGTGKVQTEAGTHVVDDEDDAVLGAKLADLLPKALGREGVVIEVAVVIRLRNQRGDLILVVLNRFFQRRNIVPREDDVVAHVLFEHAGIVLFHLPRRHAVIVALEEDDLLAVGVGTGGHHGALGGVVAVLCKECPVGGSDGVDQQVGAVHGYAHRRSGAVAGFHLLFGGGVHVGVVVAEDVRTVGAHIVDVFVAVHVPDIGALRLGCKQGPVGHGDELSLCRTEVTVDARGNDLGGLGKEFSALFMVFNDGNVCHTNASLC